MTPRSAAALAALALAAVAGCTGPAEGDRADRPQAVSRTIAQYRACPDLEPATPRADGLPDLELPCLDDGPAVNLADLRGTPTVVNVWAAWCTNCDREMPLFADAMDRAGDSVRFFGIHYKAPKGYARQSEEDFGVPFPSVHDGDGDRVVQALRATAPPQTFFVAADGRVVGRKVGEITSQAELDELIGRYLDLRL